MLDRNGQVRYRGGIDMLASSRRGPDGDATSIPFDADSVLSRRGRVILASILFWAAATTILVYFGMPYLQSISLALGIVAGIFVLLWPQNSN